MFIYMCVCVLYMCVLSVCVCVVGPSAHVCVWYRVDGIGCDMCVCVICVCIGRMRVQGTGYRV